MIVTVANFLFLFYFSIKNQISRVTAKRVAWNLEAKTSFRTD